VRLLPEEAWLYAQTTEGWWSAEIEDENVQPVPATNELKLQITQPLAEFRVRLIDEQGNSLPHDGSAAMHSPTGQQVHTMRFPRPLGPGNYRIVIDAPLGGVLRDATGRRYRGQRFRIAVADRADGNPSLSRTSR